MNFSLILFNETELFGHTEFEGSSRHPDRTTVSLLLKSRKEDEQDFPLALEE
jgi:hypothetical protein